MTLNIDSFKKRQSCQHEALYTLVNPIPPVLCQLDTLFFTACLTVFLLQHQSFIKVGTEERFLQYSTPVCDMTVASLEHVSSPCTMLLITRPGPGHRILRS